MRRTETSGQDATTSAPDWEEPTWMYDTISPVSYFMNWLAASMYPLIHLQILHRKVPVPRFAVGIVIGRNGEMIKKIQNDAGVRIQFKAGVFTSFCPGNPVLCAPLCSDKTVQFSPEQPSLQFSVCERDLNHCNQFTPVTPVWCSVHQSDHMMLDRSPLCVSIR